MFGTCLCARFVSFVFLPERACACARVYVRVCACVLSGRERETCDKCVNVIILIAKQFPVIHNDVVGMLRMTQRNQLFYQLALELRENGNRHSAVSTEIT